MPINHFGSAGLLRLLDYYVHVACAASALLTRRPTSHITDASGDPPAFAPQFRNRTDAVRWLTAERLSLQACAEWAAMHGRLNYVIATAAAIRKASTWSHWSSNGRREPPALALGLTRPG